MALTVLAAPLASAQSCAKQAASLQEKQVEAQALAEARLTLVDEVEAAGDAWENAEAMRNFGEEQAIEADTTKIYAKKGKLKIMGNINRNLSVSK